jgi:hypothetical protein
MPYDTLKQGVNGTRLLSCSAHTCDNRYFVIPRLWALYLTLPTTIFKATSVSSVAMDVMDNKSDLSALNLLRLFKRKTHGGNISRHPDIIRVVNRRLLRKEEKGYRHTSERIHQQYYIPACQPCVTLKCKLYR